jgi:hypothetical protein
VTVEEAVAERILALAPVAAIAGTRVYQLKLPQAPTLPAVRVQLIDETPSYHLRGRFGLSPARVQVDAFAEERSGADPYAEAAALADAICGDRVAAGQPVGLSGWRGDAGGSPATLRVGFVRLVDRRPMYEHGATRMVRMQLDFTVWYRPI